AAAGLRSEGLLGAAHIFTDPRIVETYDYYDENGTLLFQVVRFEPKDFRQRRPDGRGGWIWNVRDARRVLYRLPELLKALAAGETIYIPEGEKDVDNLRALHKVLRAMMQHALETGLRSDDPTRDVKVIRVKTDGYHSWTESEIEQFEARHIVGSRARLAFALLLHTGQRRSDVVRMGRQ